MSSRGLRLKPGRFWSCTGCSLRAALTRTSNNSLPNQMNSLSDEPWSAACVQHVQVHLHVCRCRTFRPRQTPCVLQCCHRDVRIRHVTMVLPCCQCIWNCQCPLIDLSFGRRATAMCRASKSIPQPVHVKPTDAIKVSQRRQDSASMQTRLCRSAAQCRHLCGRFCSLQ